MMPDSLRMTEATGVMPDPRKYVRITEDLRDKLRTGVIAAGDTVTIGRVAEEWGVSRQTVAKALCTLENDGLLTRYPGLGYYALSPEVTPPAE